jgi:predicted hydrolase (HD superfamily)
MKDKGFARGVNRDDITQGATELGVDLDEHIQFVIDALKLHAAEIGLAGAAVAQGDGQGTGGEPG